MRISDWSSDVCSSDLLRRGRALLQLPPRLPAQGARLRPRPLRHLFGTVASMALHFGNAELAGRRDRACQRLIEAGLDGLLMFRQESMYYLTGYDSFGYVFFQCLYLGADGRLMLLTRLADLRQARQTSVVKDIRIWVDGPDADPATELREALRELGCAGKRLGGSGRAHV